MPAARRRLAHAWALTARGDGARGGGVNAVSVGVMGWGLSFTVADSSTLDGGGDVSGVSVDNAAEGVSGGRGFAECHVLSTAPTSTTATTNTITERAMRPSNRAR